MPKRTYQPKKKTQSKEHGFRKRARSSSGLKIVKARRHKGRARLTH